MATGMGETLHRSPRNAESFQIKRRAFHLVPPDGELLVSLSHVPCIVCKIIQCLDENFLEGIVAKRSVGLVVIVV